MHTDNSNKRKKIIYQFNIYGRSKMWITFICMLVLFSVQAQEETFKEDQLKYDRVQNAFDEKEAALEVRFLEQGLSWPPQNIYLRAFKAESALELWVKEGAEYVLYNTYKICKPSGNFGPKRKEGDGQVPEGLYVIDRFNPISNFWLSLGINYPNKSDLILSDKSKPGGDIFIHGDCVTIGCLPMTDDMIKEIYVISVLAKNAGQNDIPVHSFPFKYNMLNTYIFYKEFPQHKEFWDNLKPAYDIFKEENRLPKYSIKEDGTYEII